MGSKNNTHYRWRGKTVSVMLSAALLVTSFTGLGSISGSAEAVTEPSSVDYGLMDTCQEGTILHCFDWKYTDIIEELPNIAAAGFTSVQTSPAQPGGGPSGSTGTWWWLYQPLDFAIGTNYLGTKAELQELCTEADKYGIKIIVDVVANHFAGDHTNIADDLKDSNYWRPLQSETYWDNYKDKRYATTHKDLGMPDIVSEDEYVQQRVAAYIQELKSAGVDGIRWDTLKHIQVPSEDCAFFTTVLDPDMYNYGESLGDPGGNDDTQNRALMGEYTGLMSVTDDVYGNDLRKNFKVGSTPITVGNWCYRGSSADKLVYWGESHDTYSNLQSEQKENYSADIDQNIIDRAYAIVASRKDATALYFSRPFETNKDDILAGVKGSTHFTSAEVAAINHFHNAMYGQSEYCINESGFSAVCREQGAVIVAVKGNNKSVSISNGGGLLNPGTYTDEISGNKFTVTSSTITGTVGSTGIAAIYEDAIFNGSIFAEKETNTAFVDTMEVKLRAVNAKNTAYTTSEGASGSFINGQTITVGSSINVGQYVTVTLTGTKSDGSALTKTYKYRKKAADERVIAYFDNLKYNWSSVYAYVYNDDGEMKKWPGTAMTYDEDTGYYKIDVTEYRSGRIIFSQNGDSTNRFPANDVPGLEIDGQNMIFGENHSWTIYELPAEKGKVSASADDGTVFTDTLDVTLYAQNVNSSSYTIDSVEKSYTNGDTITLTDTTTVTLKGIQSDGTIVTAAYTYTKTEEPVNQTVTVYFDNSAYNWNTVKAYIYNDKGEYTTWANSLPMTNLADSNIYKIDIPNDYTDDGQIIFNNGSSSQYPAQGISGLEINGSSMIFDVDKEWSAIGDISAYSKYGSGFDDTLKLTLLAEDGITDTKYEFNNVSVSYTSGDTVTIPVSDLSVGDKLTMKLSGTKSDGQTVTQTYTYQKGIKIYFEKPSAWKDAYIYVLVDNVETMSWPGKPMIYNSATGLYEYPVTGDVGDKTRVIFTDGQLNSDNTVTNRYPAAGSSTKLYIENLSHKLSKTNWKWSVYPQDISSASVELTSDIFTDDGKEKTVDVTVKFDGNVLTKDTDYTIEGDTSGTDAGTYIVKVIGKNGYKGTVKKTWTIQKSYTVTVENGNGTTTANRSNGQVFSVTADKVDNKTFSCWKVGDDIVSTSEKYGFIVLGDTTLTAVYDEDVEVQPILNMSAVKAKYNDKNAVKFIFTHSVPSDYTVTEVGIRYGTNKLAGADTTKPNYATVDLVDYGSEYGVPDIESVVQNRNFKIKQYIANYKKINGTVQFLYAVGTNTTAYVYAVGYMKLKDKDGNEQTVYSNLIHTCYDNIS